MNTDRDATDESRPAPLVPADIDPVASAADDEIPLSTEATLREEIAHLREQLDVLRSSATRYRSLVDLTTDAAYDLTMDPEASPPAVVLNWASSSMARLLGISHGALLEAGDWMDFVHPSDRSTLERHRKHLAAGSRMVTEYRIQTPTMERWVCDYSQPLHGKGGVRRVHGAIREVTHERRYDVAVRANRVKYKHIFNNSPVGIFHFDPDSTITQCNNNFVDIIGSSRSKLIGLNMLSELRDETLLAAIRRAMKHGSAQCEGNYQSVTADKVTPARVLLNSIRSENGELLGGVGIVEDITEQRRHERELIEARDEAEKMNQLKSAFLANMSHEIRTPLTAIIGFSDILTEELPSTHRRIPQLIEQSGTRLLNTLNSVLDLSMLESGEMQLKREVLDVNEHVREHVALMQPLASNKEIELTVDVPDAPRLARLDAGALDRILSNLIGNAIKFTEEGSVTVRVRDVDGPVREDTLLEDTLLEDTLPGESPTGQRASPSETEEAEASALEEGIRIDVEDTGVGISPEFLPYLFDVFKQESEGVRRSHEGSGLGLSITRHLVDGLEGTISVESEKGGGSTFSITFPRIDEQKAPEPASPPTVHPHQQGRRILVVEDTPETQVLMKRILSAYHDVDLVGTSEAALQAAHGQRALGEPAYDVILLDINLEGGASGLDLLPQLRQLPNYARTPIVATTAFALSGDRDRFLDAGFDAYVGKPFTRNQILDVIDQVLAEVGE